MTTKTYFRIDSKYISELNWKEGWLVIGDVEQQLRDKMKEWSENPNNKGCEYRLVRRTITDEVI